MAKASPGQYVREVKSEMKKVTWPSRQETTVSVIAVFIMVFIVSLFLFFSDQLLSFVVSMILNLGA
jgi:preprotein translocase subunit SecE